MFLIMLFYGQDTSEAYVLWNYFTNISKQSFEAVRLNFYHLATKEPFRKQW